MTINIRDYSYELPDNRIAVYPLQNRDESKLLVYKEGKISHTRFTDLANQLPANSFLFFNDTKVIPARLIFQKETGAQIELLLLNPVQPSSLLQLAMEATACTTWKCMIGNLKRWPEQAALITKRNNIELRAHLEDRQQPIVKFTWTPKEISFAEVVSMVGITPLPPYLHREADSSDRERYQTIYSHYEGAVAAPTAGLHFTENVLRDIKQRGIGIDFLTLHVSAGTFQPVKADNAVDHDMHGEQIIVTKKNIENLLLNRPVVAVGTTSARTLESLYWYGVKLIDNPNADFEINKLDPYQLPLLHSKKQAIEAVAKKMEKENLESICGNTSIFILPGYTFKICNALVTNFHQPGSTLMLLVAAFVGMNWKKIYEEALDNNYRFLSYGDSSLLMPTNQ